MNKFKQIISNGMFLIIPWSLVLIISFVRLYITYDKTIDWYQIILISISSFLVGMYLMRYFYEKKLIKTKK